MRRLRVASLALLAGMLVACGDRASPPVAVAPPAPTPTAPATPPSTPAPPADAAGFTPLDAAVITADDTLATLRKRHGDTQATATTVPGAEGAELDGWILFPDDPARRLYVYLDEAGARPESVRVLDPESRWQRADGLRMGLPLDELVRRNGAPVRFLGFDWDYGGSVIGWSGGTFEHDPPAGHVTLCPAPGVENVPDDGLPADYPLGDAEFDSNNAWVVAHPPTVCEFGADLAPAAAGPATP